MCANVTQSPSEIKPEIRTSPQDASQLRLASPKKARLAGTFPVEVFPDAIRSMIETVAESMGCPVDYPAAAALTVAGSMIGACRELWIKRTWQVRPAFYVALYGRPGDCKTHAVSPFLAPVKAIHNRTIAEEKQKKKDELPGPRLFAVDTTVEALAETLERSPNGILIHRDEINAWVDSMGEYKGGRGTDRQFYLSAFTQEDYVKDRTKLNGKPISVPHPMLSIIGGVQPDVLARLAGRECAAKEGDGFMHRILFVAPELRDDEHWNEADISEEQEIMWKEIVEKLVDLRRHGKRTLHFDDAGRKEWVKCYNLFTNIGNNNEDMRGPVKKLHIYRARIALVLHILHQVSRPDYTPGEEDGCITVEDMKRAGKVIDYFYKSARIIQKALSTSELDHAVDKLVAYLSGTEEREQRLSVIQRNVRLFHGSQKQTINDVKRVCQHAEQLGWGRFTFLIATTGRSMEGFYLFHKEIIAADGDEEDTDFDACPIEEYDRLNPQQQSTVRKLIGKPNNLLCE